MPDEQTIKDVFDAVKGTDLEIPVMLAAIVPMRRGEICGASIDDLDENNILHIHSSLAIGDKGTLNIKAPKTDSSDRFVELPEELADKIRKQGYICNISIKALSKRFSTALKKAGIEHFRFHDLRHAFVSIAHASGIPDAYIMSRGGWATSYTVNNVYRHVLDDDREKIEDTVNDTMGKLL
jgi:integrase